MPARILPIYRGVTGQTTKAKEQKSIRNQIEEYWSEQNKVYETQMPSQLSTWKNNKIKIDQTLTV